MLTELSPNVYDKNVNKDFVYPTSTQFQGHEL